MYPYHRYMYQPMDDCNHDNYHGTRMVFIYDLYRCNKAA